ncbi:NACHT domain-containing protein [Streptomyces bathyalis]|uniref:NACHT domain-containing protein n=1 Tax=Streptomyces bathyalis TaxID=2710756 RepID=A0A7T1WQ75_9ACTN|nr:NACHT domain-containing protein [Streptomyces bathyalis]QPP06503.1 NACHT domain-containing protein [Streptomyces bathyalis]
MGVRDVHNTVVNSTVGTLIQAGVLDLHVHVDLPAGPSQDPVELAADSLRGALFRQWRAEASAWDMAAPERISVRWTLKWDCADHARNVGLPRSSYEVLPSSMADALAGLPHRRMVLLGGPGAGKTTEAVLLALELLRRPRSSGPGTTEHRSLVPVVLSLETWDTEREHFDAWLMRRITEDHRGLPGVDGRHPAARLVSERRVLPVLDGLDELPGHRRRGVLDRLRSELTDDMPLVLTSRSDAYRELFGQGRVVPRAAVFEAEPIAAADAVDHLSLAAPPELAPRWEPVFEEMLEVPREPVAEALSSPLMLWLARKVYDDPQSDPAELVDVGRFPTAAAIESHLLDRIVDVTFTRPPASPDRLHAPGQWNPLRARRWLGHLARHLEAWRITEIAWWQLHRAWLPRLLALPALFAVSVSLSFLADAVVGLVTDDRPYDSRAVWGYSLPLLGGMLLANGVRLTAVVWFGDRLGEPRRRCNPLKLGAALRSAGRATSFRRALMASAVIATLGLPMALFALGSSNPPAYLALTGLGFVLPAILMVTFAAPSDTVDAVTPHALLRSERVAVLLTLCVVAPLIGAGNGMPLWLDDATPRSGWEWTVPAWFGAAAMLVVLSPWGRWLLAKVSLAAFGRVPWSLMEFLRDAHRGGLLQSTGGTYRFRNLRLQQHLAGAPTAPTAATAATAASGATAETAAAAAAQVPRPRPEPSLSDVWRELPPVSRWPGWSVKDTPEAFVMEGRSRRIPLAHWPLLAAFTAMRIVQMMVIGQWDEPGAWLVIAFFPAFGLLINLLAFMLPRTRLELRLNQGGIGSAIGRHRCSYAWSDVHEVRARKIYRRGRDTRHYGLHVRLRPGARGPQSRVFPEHDGWHLILPTHINDALPPDLKEALARFGPSAPQ